MIDKWGNRLTDTWPPVISRDEFDRLKREVEELRREMERVVNREEKK